MTNPPMPFDYERFDQLFAELGSQNAAFRRMGVNRSTGQRALERRERGRAPSPAVEVLPAQQPRTDEAPVPVVWDDMKGDLMEMVTWWRERKLRQTQPRRQRDMVRWTIHIDRRWRDRIMEIANAQRTRIADVVDDMCRSYCERGGAQGARKPCKSHRP
jgi:hypothetical protein